MWHQKWARHTAPFLDPMGAISVAVLKQASMELRGQNWVPQKYKLRSKIGVNFWAPLFDTICSPRDATVFQNTLIQRARFKHGRPTWRDGFSNLNQAHFQAYETTQKSKPHPKLRLLLFKKLRCWYAVENTWYWYVCARVSYCVNVI